MLDEVFNPVPVDVQLLQLQFRTSIEVSHIMVFWLKG